MKPLKSTKGLVNWMLRLSLSMVFIWISIPVVLNVNLDSPDFYIALVELIFAGLLFIAGFLTKHTLTVLSGLVLFIIGIYLIISGWSSKLDALFFNNLLKTSVALYFVSNGNRK